MDESGRKPWFKVFDIKLTDLRFSGWTNADWGVFHKLECLANQQPERGIIRLPPHKFCSVLAKNLGIRIDKAEKYLTKFKEPGSLDYSSEEGWIDFIYFKEKQKPLSDAERKRRQREREKSRHRDENVTEDVTQKKREEYTRKDNRGVTAPPPFGGAGGVATPLVEDGGDPPWVVPDHDGIISTTEEIADKCDCPELVAGVKELLAQGVSNQVISFALMDFSADCKSLKGADAEKYFRKLLSSRSKESNQ